MSNCIEVPPGTRTRAKPVRCLVMCCVACAAFQEMLLLGCFSGGHHMRQRSAGLRTTLRVRERLSSLSRPNQPDDSNVEVRRLNSRLKQAGSEVKLIGILNEKVDAPFFDPIHASTAYHKLAAFAQLTGSLPSSCANSPALLRLQARTRDFIKQKQMQSWACANVFWAMPILLEAIPAVIELVHELAKVFPARARSMNARDLANSAWAAAKLKDVARDDVRKIIVALAGRISSEACHMNPQELSNSWWAAARLKDLTPVETVKMAPALAAQVLRKADGFNPQDLSNCLWAAGQLKDLAPDDAVKVLQALTPKLPGKANAMTPQDFANSLYGLVVLQDLTSKDPALGSGPATPAGSKEAFLNLAALRITDMLPNLSGKDLYLDVPIVVWACGRFGLPLQPLLTAVARRFGSSAKLSSSRLPDWDLCALTWSYQMLDAAGQFGDFQKALGGKLNGEGCRNQMLSAARMGTMRRLRFAGDK